MTPKQEEQFKKFGCVPRSLIALTNIMGKPLSRDEFLAKFDHLFFEADKYGLLYIGSIAEILRSLELAKSFTIHIDRQAIDSLFKSELPQPILLLTEKAWTPDVQKYTDFGHCYLVDWEQSLKVFPQNDNVVLFDTDDEGRINPQKRGSLSFPKIQEMNGYFLVPR
jgi:hypothetical protein